MRFIIHTFSGDCPRSQRGFHEGSKACNGASQEQRVQPVLGQNFHIPHHGAWRRPPRAEGGTSQTNSALFGEVEIPFRFQQSLVLPSIINLQVKDHSKTGKDEHLGSFAARISDMQEGKHQFHLLLFKLTFQATDEFSSVTIPEEKWDLPRFSSRSPKSGTPSETEVPCIPFSIQETFPYQSHGSLPRNVTPGQWDRNSKETSFSCPIQIQRI